MKKVFSVMLTLVLAFCTVAVAESEATPISVLVSITDDTGAVVAAIEMVTVSDEDGDGVITINDALYAAHVARHENGAEAYGFEKTEYGLSMTRLWGVENDGSYGYYVNDVSGTSLLDPISEYDHVKAFVYTDLTAWSDTYCYFDAIVHNDIIVDTEYSMNLSAAGFDADYNPVELPVEGAVITVNGEPTDIVTDAEGNFVIAFEEAGEYLISAYSDTHVLVAPVCLVEVLSR